jgi:hypothetical protein
MFYTRHADTLRAPEADCEQEKLAPKKKTSALDPEYQPPQPRAHENRRKRRSSVRTPNARAKRLECGEFTVDVFRRNALIGNPSAKPAGS